MSKKKKLVPEIRFRGFRDNWEQVKLEHVLEESKERCGDSKKYELLTLSGKEGIMFQKDSGRKDTSSENKNKYWVVRPNYMVCNAMVMWKGTLGVSKLTGLTSPDYYVMKISDDTKNSMTFFENYFKVKWVVDLFDIEAQGLGTKRRLKYPKLSQIQLPTPKLEEQLRISNFILNVDKSIELQSEEIQSAKEWKRGLLQRMFV